MSTVTHLMRYNAPGNYSIENVFRIVREELKFDYNFHVSRLQAAFDVKSLLIPSDVIKKSEVLHLTGGANYMAFASKRRKTVLTVHDIGHYTNTLTGLKKAIYGELWFRLPLARANVITAVSEFTANELHRIFNVPYSKIEIIRNPVGKDFKQKKNIGHNNGKFTILQIGSGEHKNLSRLIEACNGLKTRLILVRRKDERLKFLLDQNKVDYEWYSDLKTDHLVELYQKVDLLYFASTYEGFGLPIIEAQVCGTPVITSNISPMKEVAGKGGAYFVDPYSFESIRKAVQAIMDSRNLRFELISRGLDNAKLYAADRVSKAYGEVYNSLLT